MLTQFCLYRQKFLETFGKQETNKRYLQYYAEGEILCSVINKLYALYIICVMRQIE